MLHRPNHKLPFGRRQPWRLRLDAVRAFATAALRSTPTPEYAWCMYSHNVAMAEYYVARLAESDAESLRGAAAADPRMAEGT